jgi:alpha-tubulin suppressor-like RCC1 family protein
VYITAIAAGSAHTFTLTTDDKIWAAGGNGSGEFGLGNESNIKTLTEVSCFTNGKITAFGVGENHLIARDESGKVWASGLNVSYQIGSGYFTSRTVFAEVTDLRDKNITAFGAGYDQTFALDNQGNVWASGYNASGQLGLGNTVEATQFTQVTSLSGTITAIAVGQSHTIALGSDGTLWVTGRNAEGQLGLGDTTGKNTFTQVSGLSAIVAIAAGWAHTIALGSDGTVWVTGKNTNGQLGLGDTTDRNVFTIVPGLTGITAIAAGENHTIVLGNDGIVRTTGKNDYGQLGLEDNTDKNTFIQVDVNGITAIAAGNFHTIVLDGTHKVWTTGCNNKGQLGLGDTTDRNVFTKVP